MIQIQQPNKAFTAEKSVIGAVMIDETVLGIAREIVSVDDFFTATHQQIFKSMCELADAGAPINLASLSVNLANNQQFNNDGGIQYLIECSHTCVSASMIEYDAKLVRDDSVRRKLLSFSDSVKAIATQNVADIDAVISSLSTELLSLSETTAVTPWVPISASLKRVCSQMLDDSVSETIPSGFIDLDAKLTGFKPGTLTIIAARPAMGKTAFGLNIMSNMAIDGGIPVAFFSLEMTADELTNRLISCHAKVNGNAIRQKKMSENEYERYLDAVKIINDAKVYIDETPALDISVLRDRARRMSVQYGIKALIVDYLQLMTSGNKRVQNREQEIATISRGLKNIAKELHIPVIAMAQLNRAVETRAEKRPVLSDLRESGSMEQDADVVMFIHREDYYQPNAEPTHEAEVIIAKHRNGPTGVVKLHWQGEYTLFSNAEHQDEYF